jgi:hypothetical protein
MIMLVNQCVIYKRILDDGGGKLGPVDDCNHSNSNESSMNDIAPGVVDEYTKLFLPEELAIYGPRWFELPHYHDDGRTVYQMYKSRKQLGTNKGKPIPGKIVGIPPSYWGANICKDHYWQQDPYHISMQHLDEVTFHDKVILFGKVITRHQKARGKGFKKGHYDVALFGYKDGASPCYCELPIEDVWMFLLEDTFWIPEIEKAMEEGKPPFALPSVPREKKPAESKDYIKGGSKEARQSDGKGQEEGSSHCSWQETVHGILHQPRSHLPVMTRKTNHK